MRPERIYTLHEPEADSFVNRLLANRGITDEKEVEAFLNPDYEEHLHDPFLMQDMEKAVSRTWEGIEKEEYIAIFSDYDCDGIPGGTVLHDFFKAIGYEQFQNYIPHRHEEGYGFNAGAVAKFNKDGVHLIITIDCGTVDHEALAAAKEAGIPVIIIDHHEAGKESPDCYALLNPKCEDSYPFKGLCAAGVTYKFVQALITEGRKRGKVDLPEGWEKWLLDLVGIATIADMVPLVGENRALAHYGLKVLRKSRRPGLHHLVRKNGLRQHMLTEDDIGFTIGPRINAASRMDTPEDAFTLLSTTDEVEAGTRAAHLEKLNRERKTTVAVMSRELKRRLEKLTEIPKVIVIGNPEWKPALVGLSANSLVETYQRPVFVWGRDGQGVIKGSCRSDGSASVVDLMQEASHALLGFGGHKEAGGFSVSEEHIHILSDALNEAYEKLSATLSETEEIFVDADIALEDINETFLRDLRTLAPFGMGNPKPLFRILNAKPIAIESFGKGGDHTKVKFGAIDAIAFFKKPEEFMHLSTDGCTLIAHVEESFFLGRKETRLRIVDVLPK